MSRPHTTHHPFLQFTHDVVVQPAVKSALKRLRARPVLNINIVLYALWYGANQRGRLLKPEIKTLFRAIHTWHTRIFLPLKQIAQDLNKLNPQKNKLLQEAIETTVIMAKESEQQFLADSLFKLNFRARSATRQLNDACHNIKNYCKLVNVRLDDEEQEAVNTLLQVVFSKMSTDKISATCQAVFNPTTPQKDNSFAQLSLEAL